MIYRKHFIIHVIIGILLVVTLQNSSSQNPNYKFRHLTEIDGLPSLNIQCMLRDSKGFMWIGTESGLCKYDGQSITVFTENNYDKTSLVGNYVRALVENDEGNLWIGTTRGLCLYSRDINKFVHYLPEPGNKESINSTLIYSIAKDKNENLWIASNDSGLIYFNVKLQKFQHFMHNKSDNNSIINNSLTKVYLDKRGRLWIGTISGALDLYIDSTKQFKHIFLPDQKRQSFNRDQIRDIIEDYSGNIWVGTSGSGIFRIRVENNDINIEQFLSHSNTAIDISNNYISSFEVDKYGNLLVGSENGGINYIDFRHNKKYHFTSNIFDNQSLSNISVWDLYIDKESNLWVSCYSKGIDVNFSEEFGFKHYYNIANNNQSLGYNTVSCFFEDSKGNMWVGTDGGGLDLFNKKTGTFKHYTTKNSSIPNDAVLNVFEDRHGVLWVGTWSGGLSVFDFATGSFKTFTTENSGISCNNIISIIEDKSGLLWAGTFWCEGGLNSYNREKNLFQNYTVENSRLTDNTIFCLKEDCYGLLWMGTNNGLSCYDKINNRFINFRPNENDSSTISQGTVISILESRDSVLWFGTSNGLNQFIRKTHTFKRYYEMDGLPNSYIAGMEEDDEGNIWISTQNGISKFNTKTNHFTNYNPSFGSQGKQYYRCSHYKGRDGTIYFGGINGFNMFNPKQVKDNKYKPPIYFTNFSIFNKTASIGLNNSPLKKHISAADKVVLTYRQNSFTFEFTAINYISAKETRFAYMLEGFDKNWNYSGTQRSASYTNIDPGKYTFKVKVPYNSGIENEDGISIQVIITPPFRETWWFRLVSLIFIIILLFGFFAYRIRAINDRNRHLSNLVDERTQELKQKNSLLKKQTDELYETNILLEKRQELIEEKSKELIARTEELENSNTLLQEVNATKDKFFSIIAHDIKNPFNNILGFADLLKLRYDDWTDGKRKQMIGLFSESAENVYQLLENLLQWSSSQRGIIEFRPEKIQLEIMIEKILAVLIQNARQKNIELNIQVDEDSQEIYADPQMLDTIIRNLLSNAIKFTNIGGKIKITAQTIDGNINIEIADNGIGMTEENISKLFRIDSNYSTLGTNKEKGTGLGLILVKEFVSKHNGVILVKSEPSKGSTFTVIMPL
jgi:signal transduction histidine kinase/ligand-binding sensor domain-containing protein